MTDERKSIWDERPSESKERQRTHPCLIASVVVVGLVLAIIGLVALVAVFNDGDSDGSVSTTSGYSYSSDPLGTYEPGLLPNRGNIRFSEIELVDCIDYNTVESGRRVYKEDCARTGHKFLLAEIDYRNPELDDTRVHGSRWRVVTRDGNQYSDAGYDHVVRLIDCISSSSRDMWEDRRLNCTMRFEVPISFLNKSPQLVFRFEDALGYGSSKINWSLDEAELGYNPTDTTPSVPPTPAPTPSVPPTPAPTPSIPSAQAPIPADFSVYEEPLYGYHISHPSDWGMSRLYFPELFRDTHRVSVEFTAPDSDYKVQIVIHKFIPFYALECKYDIWTQVAGIRACKTSNYSSGITSTEYRFNHGGIQYSIGVSSSQQSEFSRFTNIAMSMLGSFELATRTPYTTASAPGATDTAPSTTDTPEETVWPERAPHSGYLWNLYLVDEEVKAMDLNAIEEILTTNQIDIETLDLYAEYLLEDVEYWGSCADWTKTSRSKALDFDYNCQDLGLKLDSRPELKGGQLTFRYQRAQTFNGLWQRHWSSPVPVVFKAVDLIGVRLAHKSCGTTDVRYNECVMRIASMIHEVIMDRIVPPKDAGEEYSKYCFSFGHCWGIREEFLD